MRLPAAQQEALRQHPAVQTLAAGLQRAVTDLTDTQVGASIL